MFLDRKSKNYAAFLLKHTNQIPERLHSRTLAKPVPIGPSPVLDAFRKYKNRTRPDRAPGSLSVPVFFLFCSRRFRFVFIGTHVDFWIARKCVCSFLAPRQSGAPGFVGNDLFSRWFEHCGRAASDKTVLKNGRRAWRRVTVSRRGESNQRGEQSLTARGRSPAPAPNRCFCRRPPSVRGAGDSALSEITEPK